MLFHVRNIENGITQLYRLAHDNIRLVFAPINLAPLFTTNKTSLISGLPLHFGVVAHARLEKITTRTKMTTHRTVIGRRQLSANRRQWIRVFVRCHVGYAAKQSPCVGMTRVAENVPNFALLHHPPRIHHINPLAGLKYQTHVV